MSRVKIIIPASKDGTRSRLEFSAGIDLLALDLKLSQDERASTIAFTIDDRGGKIGGILLGEALAIGGIIAPKDLLEDPSSSQSGTNNTTNQAGGGDAKASRVQAEELTPRQKAALDTIAFCEGTIGARGYETIVGYTYFTGNQHPGTLDPQLYKKTGLNSDASGRYQYLSTTWETLGMPDFSPKNQDRGTIKYLDRLGATAAVNSGNIDQFLRIASSSAGWASFPYSNAGQGGKTIAEATQAYENAYKFYSGLTQQSTQAALINLAGIPSSSIPTATKQATERDRLASLAGTPLNTRLEAIATAPATPLPTTLVGTPLIVECQKDNVSVSYEFLLLAVELNFLTPDSTQIRGGSVKAQIKILNGNTKSGSYKNISLAKFAQIVSDRASLQPPEILGTDASFRKANEIVTEVGQQGRSDLQLLNEFASRQGFAVREGDGRLILEPVISVVIPAVLTPDVLLEINESMLLAGSSFSEAASSDRITGEALPDIGVEILSSGSITKGFLSKLVLAPSGEILKLKPGGVIKLNHKRLPKAVNRLWRIDMISLNPFSNSWTINVFLPVRGNQTTRSGAGAQTGGKNGLQGGSADSRPLPDPKGTYMLMRPTGGDASDGLGGKAFNLALITNGVQSDVVEVISGYISNQNPVPLKQDSVGSGRPTPEGIYSLGAVEVAPGGGIFSAALGNTWVLVIGTEPYRSAIGIHSDYNRTTSAGSAGCICPLNQAGINKVAGWRNSGVSTLIVDHGLGSIPIKLN